MKHLSPTDLSALSDGALSGRAREQAERHLGQCATCRDALARIAAQDSALKSALAHDPGEAYFESFAARVEARLGAPSQRSEARSLAGPWWSRPRSLAWMGGAAAVVVVAGLVLVMERESTVPELPRGEMSAPSDHVPQSATELEANKRAPTAGEFRAPAPATRSNELQGAYDQSKAGKDDKVRSEDGVREGAAGKQKPAAISKEGAQSGRLGEVRRDQYGEEFAVPRDSRSPSGPSNFAPAPGSKVVKPRPEPLAQSPPASNLSKTSPSEPSATSRTADRDQGRARNLPAPTAGAAQELAIPSVDEALASQVCGQVRDPAGRPVVGAQVVVTDLGLTASTGPDGRFCVAVPRGTHTISIMSLGFQAVRRSLAVSGAVEEEDVTLEPVSVLGDRLGRVGSAHFTALDAAGQRQTRLHAERLYQQAEKLRTAAAFDSAAAGWEQALPGAGSGPAALEARRRLAESRYRAWEIGPTPGRAAAAARALSAYIASAPAGEARNRARLQLARVRK